MTPLHNACAQGHQQVVRLLIARGADIEKGEKGGFTALHVRARILATLFDSLHFALLCFSLLHFALLHIASLCFISLHFA
jgi:hypothetical protein